MNEPPNPTTDFPYSEPVMKVLHCASVASLGDGKLDGVGADMEDVRDLLVSRFGMTVVGAIDAIEMAMAEGALDRGDPEL